MSDYYADEPEEYDGCDAWEGEIDVIGEEENDGIG